MKKVFSWLWRTIGGGRETEEHRVRLRRAITAAVTAVALATVGATTAQRVTVPLVNRAISGVEHFLWPAAIHATTMKPDTITGPGGKCVDVLGNDTGGNFAYVDLWDCQPSALDQHWQPGNDGRLRTLGEDCLDIDKDSRTVGAYVELFQCNIAGGQIWVAEPNGTLVNPQSHLCLDDPGASTVNGTRLQIQPCDASLGERFTVHGDIPLASRITGPAGKCVDVLGDDTGIDHASVDLWRCQFYAQDQHWYRNPDNSLETLGRCLSIDGNDTVPGTYVELLACNKGGEQKWTPRRDGTLVNPRSGLCLDDPGGNTTNRTQLRIWNCTNAPEEKFKLGY